MTFTIDPGPLTTALAAAHQRLDDRQFAAALRTRRLDVWTADTAVQRLIGNRLGWLEALDFVAPQLPRLRTFAASIRGAGLTDVVLLGMGGSSLAPEVLRRVVGAAPGMPRFRVLDSVDPDAVRDALARAETSLFVLASKSGSTIEPNVMAAEAERRLRAAGVTEPGGHFVAVTDEGTALHRRATAEHFRDVFVNRADIGGRYSALSLFGLVPAALMGLDLDALLAPATQMADACQADDSRRNPGLALGAFMATAAQSGRDKLTLVMPERLQPFGLWIEQLVAESTGKTGTGIVPIAGEPANVPFGDDRAVVATVVTGDRADAADMPGVPRAVLEMRDVLDLGAEFFRWEMATAAAGFLLGVNPFDEPNVQQAKDATRRLLTSYASRRQLPVPEPDASVDDCRLALTAPARDALAGAAPDAFLSVASRGDYLGVLIYLPPDDPQVEAALQPFRHAFSSATSCATMVGYGPRYLHSTGQLYKGGPDNGVFIVVTADASTDLPVPGEPFSFGVLELAQAIGDFQSLEQSGRRALYVHLARRDPARLGHLLQHLLTRRG